MVKCRAVVRPLVTQSNISVDMLFETFLTILKDIYATRRDWKVYIQVVTDLGKVIVATASKERRMLLITGSKEKPCWFARAQHVCKIKGTLWFWQR